MGTNIALVVLDSVRADYFADYFDWLDGIHFTNAWSTGNYSIPAHGSLFAGRYPSELGVHAKAQALDCPDPVLAEQFRTAGYRTRAYSANALVGPDLDFDRGFDEYNMRWDLSATFPELFSWRDVLAGSDQGMTTYLQAVWACLRDRESRTVPSLRRAVEVYKYADEGAAEALKFLRRTDFGDDEFLFMNLMEAHWPFWGSLDRLTYRTNPVDEQPETVPGGDIDLSAHEMGYEEWVAYLSEQYRTIHDLLLEEFDYVVTLADHGELFGEQGARAHFYGLFEDLVHVPLVISDGSGTREDRDDIVSLVDVHATITALADLPASGRGTDLMATRQSDPRLVEFHGFRDHRLDTLSAQGFSATEIDRYDQYRAGVVMLNDYYGHETVDGFVGRGEPESDPHVVLDELRESLDVRAIQEDEGSIGETTQARLEALGYVD